ncbi:MAG: hypothetical protein R2861_04425 [Desulfobacterales bacterium]
MIKPFLMVYEGVHHSGMPEDQMAAERVTGKEIPGPDTFWCFEKWKKLSGRL